MDAGIAEDNVAWLRDRLPLSGGQPPTHPPLRPRAVHRHRDPVAPQGRTRWWMRTEARCACRGARQKGGGDRQTLRRALRERVAKAPRAAPHPQGASLAADRADPGALPRRRAALHRGPPPRQSVTWKRRPLAGTMLTHPGVYCPAPMSTTGIHRPCGALTPCSPISKPCSALSSPNSASAPSSTKPRTAPTVTCSSPSSPTNWSRPSAGASPNTERTPVGPLRRILQGQHRVTASFRRKDGRTLHVRKATRAEQPQLKIYTALDPSPN